MSVSEWGGGAGSGGGWKREGGEGSWVEISAVGAKTIREGEKCTLSISLNKGGFSAGLAEVAGWRRDASVPRLLIVRRIDVPHVSHPTAQSTHTIRNTIDLLPYLTSPTR